jgi:hypothetical protein
MIGIRNRICISTMREEARARTSSMSEFCGIYCTLGSLSRTILARKMTLEDGGSELKFVVGSFAFQF